LKEFYLEAGNMKEWVSALYNEAAMLQELGDLDTAM
jgi:hypothetical protein